MENSSKPTAPVRTDQPRRRTNPFKVVVAAVWAPVCLVFIAPLVFAAGAQLAGFDSASFANEDGGIKPTALLMIYAAISALALVFSVAPTYRLLFGHGHSLREALGFSGTPKWRDLGLAMLCYMAYFAATIIVTTIILQAVPGFNVNEEQDIGFNQPTDMMGYVLAFIGLVVLPPLLEELLFRGYMFSALRRSIGYVVTSLIVSIGFGAAHQQWNVAIDTFVLSLFLCYLRERTGSIYASIMLHALKNLSAFILLFVVKI